MFTSERLVAESKSTTMVKVARRAKVSRSAVSAALSNKASTVVLSEQTRARILKAARELGYRPNILSQSFIKQRSFLIGLIGREAFFVFALDTIKGLEEVLRPTQFSLLVTYDGNWSDDQSNHLEKHLSRRVDGLIIIGAPERAGGPNHRTIKEMQERGVPVVQLYRPIFPNVPVVMIDEERAAYLETQHLLELGHRKIAHVTHDGYLDQELPGKYGDALYRYNGYRRAMQEAGLEPHVFTMSGSTLFHPPTASERPANTTANRLVSEGFTAAVAFNDYFVIELISQLADLGVRVPDDISLVGYDNVVTSELVRPSVTTIRPAMREVGRRAAQLILDMLDGRSVSDVVLPPELVVRQSSGPVRSKNLDSKSKSNQWGNTQ